MKIVIIILAIVLAIGFYFRADIFRLYSDAIQKITDIEKVNISAFEKIKEDITAIVENESRIFAPPPLKALEEASNSFLTLKGTITETNGQRLENNLAPLRESIKLNEAAKAKARDMFDGQYFEHTSPSGKGPADLAKDADYEFLIIGENLALGNFEDDKKLVKAWMASPGHRANILNSKYTEIGVAVEKGMYEGHSVWMAVQEFGRPAFACPKVDQALKTKISDYNFQLDEMSKNIESEKLRLENTEVVRKNVSDYNARVNAYNDLIRQYNILVAEAKIAVAVYNRQVQAYNECLK